MTAHAPSGQDETSNPNSSSLFLQLPPELKIQIVKALDISDIAYLRCISRDWADVGAPELFKDGFSLRPHRDDMARLQAVCKHPDIAKGIKHLDICTGSIDGQQFVDAVKELDKKLSESNKRFLDKIFVKLFPATPSTHCDRETLEKLFPLLPNLTSITATASKSPFATNLNPVTRKPMSPKLAKIFHDIWDNLEANFDSNNRSNFYDNAVSFERYSSILFAALKLQTPVQKLVLDSFPIDCFLYHPRGVTHSFLSILSETFVVDKAKVDELMKTVAGVKDLQISLLGSGNEDDVYSDIYLARSIGKFIGSMQQLRNLQIQWLVEEETTVGFQEAFERSFYSTYFPHLEDLRLIKMDSTEKKLTKFILRHRSTLKRLHLGIEAMWTDWEQAGMDIQPDNPETRSWKDIFTEYKEGFPKLEKFEYLENNSDPQRIYDDDWNPIPIERNQRVPIAKLLELYVLGKCPWPMASDNPRGWRGWKPKFMGSHLDFMNLSTEELDELLGGDWETEESEESDSDDDMLDVSDSEDDSDEGYDSEEDESYLDAVELFVNGGFH